MSIDRVVAVRQLERAVRGLGAEVLDLDEDLVRRLVGDVAAHVERDDADVVAAPADGQVADVDLGEVDRGEVLRQGSGGSHARGRAGASGNAPSETSTISGFSRSRSASAAAPSARVRSAGVSLAVMPSTILSSIGPSLENRDIGVAWPSTFITIATSPPPMPSISCLACCFAASMPAGRAGLVAVHRLHRRRGVEQDHHVARLAVELAPSVGSSAANSTSAEDEQDQQQRHQALELLPQRVGVLLLEDALPQLRERHLEAAAPHLDDVRADREHGRADRRCTPTDRERDRARGSSPQEAPGPEDLQDELVERDRGVRAEERHRVLRAVRLELLAVLLVLALVGLEQRPARS